MDPIFKRIVLKISGESLAGKKGVGVDTETVNQISKEVKKLHKLGVQVSIIVSIVILFVIAITGLKEQESKEVSVVQTDAISTETEFV